MMDVLGFNITSNPPPSPSGPILLAGAGGSLTTGAGTWSFGATAPGGFAILLNGQPAVGGSAESLEAAAGNLFADTMVGHWYEWSGSGWVSFAGPPPSPDGSVLLAGGGGSLTTSGGTWSFGATAPGGFSILLNGQPAAGGSAESLEVAANGSLFADNILGQWYEWSGSGWNPLANPPPSPNGPILLAGGGGSLTTSAGTWSFGAVAPGGFSILLNGQPAAGGSAESLEAATGNLFADNVLGHWYEWSGSGWVSFAGPPPSPDGSVLLVGAGGSLTTSGGTWSFGATALGGFSILLNGQPAAGGSAESLEVAANGNMFADNILGQWYEWSGSGWNPLANLPSSGASSASLTKLALGTDGLTAASPLLHV